MFRGLIQFLKGEGIPLEAKIITWATSIRWLGWGFAEPLIPVFIFSFGSSFAEAGIIKSSYDILYIILLPVIGILVKRIHPIKLMFMGYILYVFIGFSYFLSGIYSIVLFVVLAKSLNGISYAMDGMSTDVILAQSSAKKDVATRFGYFDTIANLGWIIGAIIGMGLILYFPVYILLLLVVPTTIIAFLIIYIARKKGKFHSIESGNVSHKKVRLSRLFHFNINVKSIIFLDFFTSFTISAIGFYLPITSYNEGASLSMVLFIGIIGALPYLLGFQFGKLFDRKGARVLEYALASLIGIVLLLAFVNNYIFILIAYFGVFSISEVLAVSSKELIAVNTKPEHFADADSITKSIAAIGSLVGPMVTGLLMDSFGIRVAYILIAMVFLGAFLGFLYVRKHGTYGKITLLEVQSES